MQMKIRMPLEGFLSTRKRLGDQVFGKFGHKYVLHELGYLLRLLKFHSISPWFYGFSVHEEENRMPQGTKNLKGAGKDKAKEKTKVKANITKKGRRNVAPKS